MRLLPWPGLLALCAACAPAAPPPPADPERGLFVAILTNRVHIAGDNQRHVPFRRAIIDAVHEAIRDAPLTEWEKQR
jgi:hypothetical protein